MPGDFTYRDERDRKIRNARRDVTELVAASSEDGYRLLVDNLCRNAPDVVSAACARLLPHSAEATR